MTSTQLSQAQQSAEPVSYDLPWGTLRGLQWGNPTGQPILALHGWLDNCHSFLPVADTFIASALAQDYRLIALDWAGHGHSDHRPAGNYYHFIDYVYDIWYLIEQQQWSAVHLLGHSMGGFVANMLAAVAPQSVATLTTIEAFGLLAGVPNETAASIRKGFTSRWQQQSKRRPRYPDIASAINARVIAGDVEREHAEMLVMRGLQSTEAGDYQFRADGFLRVLSPFRITVEQVSDVMASIECPFHVVLGDQGHQQLSQALSQWQTCVPQLQLHKVAGGHHVHMQQPQAIIDVITSEILANKR